MPSVRATARVSVRATWGRCRARPRRGRPRVHTVTSTGAGCSRGGGRLPRCGPARDRSRRPSRRRVGRGARPGLASRAMMRALAALARAAARARGRGLLRGAHVPHEAPYGHGHSVVRLVGWQRVGFTRWQPRIRLPRRGPAPGIFQPAVPLACHLPNPPRRTLVWLARLAWHVPNELDRVNGRARRNGRSLPQPDGRGSRGRLNPHAGVGVGGRSSRARVSAGRRSGHVAVGGRSRGRVSCSPVGGRSVGGVSCSPVGGGSRPVVLTGLIYIYIYVS